MQLDAYMWGIVLDDSNMAVPWYLMTSYLYYDKDQSILSDHAYDKLCAFILSEWDEISHRHKYYIDKEALSAGTGYYLDSDILPSRVTSAADRLAKEGIPC